MITMKIVQRTIFLRRASVRGTSISCSGKKMARRLPLLATHKTMTLKRKECSRNIASVRLWDALCDSRTPKRKGPVDRRSAFMRLPNGQTGPRCVFRRILRSLYYDPTLIQKLAGLGVKVEDRLLQRDLGIENTL